MTRNEKIDLLENYSTFLAANGYMDDDWRSEPPYAIDRFLELTEAPNSEDKGVGDLWQTVNPNLPKYAMSSNLNTDGMPINWIDVWCEVEIWYGDHTKKETAEQLLVRLQKKFKLTKATEDSI